MGYYRKSASGTLPNQCVSCSSTAGTYMSVAGNSTACFQCTNKPASNTYYLLPVAGGFNGTSNNCPWYVLWFFSWGGGWQ